MRICIDSNVFIVGLERRDPEAEMLLQHLPQFHVVVPRLIMREVSRNLSGRDLDKQFFRFVQNNPRFQIVDAPIPDVLVQKYTVLGLPDKADAFIGAFAEWMRVRYLISDNRHFLNLSTDAFSVLSSGAFMARFRAGTL